MEWIILCGIVSGLLLAWESAAYLRRESGRPLPVDPSGSGPAGAHRVRPANVPLRHAA
jgi:hypothetical protein